MASRDLLPTSPELYTVFRIRGRQVVLDSDVARGFGVETKRVNEAATRNPHKFGDEHVFQLTPEEHAALRSQIATPNSRRGGPRYPPRAYTAKGVARLATVLESDQALRATDLIIDTFLEVQAQIAAGQSAIAIHQPSRLRPEAGGGMRAKLAAAIDALLDTVIDQERHQTVRSITVDLGGGALDNLRERLRAKGLENAKLEADALLVLAQAEKVYVEARKHRAEAEGIELENITRRINTVKELMKLNREAEPDEIVQMLTALGRPTLRALPPPTEEEDDDHDDDRED